MNKEELNLEYYPRGIVVRLNWNRGNGNLERDYIYLGNNSFDGSPMLLDYENFQKNKATFFDFSNPDLLINNTSVTTHKSLDGLINLDNPKNAVNSSNPHGEMFRELEC